MPKPVQLNPISPYGSTPAATRPARPAGEQDFASTLQHAQAIRFSTHAQKRLEKREIRLSDDGLARLAQAVEKVEKHGGRESLVLMDGLAFIVNVQERLVVTALDPQSRREGIFTQIDSVVLADAGFDRQT